MSITAIEKYLASLRENYASLSQAYRRGEFEDEVEFTAAEGGIRESFKETFRSLPVKIPMIDSGKRNKLVPFRDAAVRLFKQAQKHEAYKELSDLPIELKERLAEYKTRAQALSYEITDFFITGDEDMSKHFLKLTGEATKDIKSYYQRNFGFIIRPQVKVAVVKQIVLGALFGVNALYRSYDPTRIATGLGQVDYLINFLEGDFSGFCERDNTAFGLIGLAYFLKGRLLLSKANYKEAESCFRLSAENYVRKLPNKGDTTAGSRRGDDKEKVSLQSSDIGRGSTEVPVSELLALRRAALALAFGSGYSALINSRVKEANSLLTLARGILHFNAPKVYVAYTELLYWSAKRAEKSNDEEILREAKKRIEECRAVFEAQVNDSHYPHRASIEHSLVLHYLAQHAPAERAKYYEEAIEELEAAVKYAEGDGDTRKPNKQLYAEACYILSHILRYQSADLFLTDASTSVAKLKKALTHAKAAQAAARHFPRHRCEALLALSGVYADVEKRDIKLSDIDSQSKPEMSAGRLSRSNTCKVLEINNGANHRISAICYLRLVDYYLKNPNTYSRAYSYWDEWMKIKSSIEHAFVNEWAERTESELDKTKERTFVIDFDGARTLDELRNTLDASFAKYKIAEWVRFSHSQYQFKGDQIKKRKMGRRRQGPNVSLQAGLEKFLEETLKVTANEAKELISKHELLEMVESLMQSYLVKE